MTHDALILQTSAQPFYSYLDLLERNEYLQEELRVCRKRIEEVEVEMARLTEQLRIAQNNELLASREVRKLRSYLSNHQATRTDLLERAHTANPSGGS